MNAPRPSFPPQGQLPAADPAPGELLQRALTALAQAAAGSCGVPYAAIVRLEPHGQPHRQLHLLAAFGASVEAFTPARPLHPAWRGHPAHGHVLRDDGWQGLALPDGLRTGFCAYCVMPEGTGDASLWLVLMAPAGVEVAWSPLQAQQLLAMARAIAASGQVAQAHERQALQLEGLRSEQRRQREASAVAGRIARVGTWSCEPPWSHMELSAALGHVLALPADVPLAAGVCLAALDDSGRRTARRLLLVCLRRGEPFDAEFALRAAAGRPAWVRAVGEAVRDEGGRIVRMRGTVQDISERQAAERQQLRDARARDDVVDAQRSIALHGLDFAATLQVLVEHARALTGASGALAELVEGAAVASSACNGPVVRALGSPCWAPWPATWPSTSATSAQGGSSNAFSRQCSTCHGRVDAHRHGVLRAAGIQHGPRPGRPGRFRGPSPAR